MVKAAIIGLLLGLPAGISPGPTVALVISEAINRGAKYGIAVALGPVATDPLIVFLSLIFVGKAAHISPIRASIDILGTLYIAHLVWREFHPGTARSGTGNPTLAPFWKGVILNAMNPNPYIFWFTVGAPMIVQLRAASPTANTALFITGFYTTFIGSKVAIAAISGQSRRFVNGVTLSRIGKSLTLTMLGFGGLLLWDAVKLLTAK